MVVLEEHFAFPDDPALHLEADQQKPTVVPRDVNVFIEVKGEELVPAALSRRFISVTIKKFDLHFLLYRLHTLHLDSNFHFIMRINDNTTS